VRDPHELASLDRPILWDLDGTIADTRRDIASGVAGLLGERGHPPLPLDQVLRNVGSGVRHLVTRCLEDVGRPATGEKDLADAIRLFREHYARHLMDTTRPYGDLAQTLLTLVARGRKMAVVSNKPEDLSRSIVQQLGLLPCFFVVLGGDSLPSRKPSGEPFLQALRLGCPGTPPEDAIVVGDSMFDLEAARSAGMPICAVAWGYDPDQRLRPAQPDWWMERPEELSHWLLGEASVTA
jgi:phosphoglycolate phosphatase